MKILAPVGSWDTLQAAIQGGADAVYFGVGHLNMRSKSSKSFQLGDVEKIIRICAENNVDAYVTVNTIIYDEEVHLLYDLLCGLKKHGVAAVIASDFAVITQCQQLGIPIHASTQLNISNIEAVRYFSKYCDVMVLARELTLNQVATITAAIQQQQIKGPSGNLVQIEVFAHGALCMAVSGKCYLSLDNFNQSANRGACIQVCRRGYHVQDIDNQVELTVENEYIMSPKDLKTIDFLDRLYAAGVSVLKIEGRARSPEYVKTVTSVYKDAVICLKSNAFTEINKRNWNEQLSSVFNRGFWEGYYMGKKIGEWAEVGGSQATQTKEYVARVTNYFTKIGVVELTFESGHIAVGDSILITGSTTGVVELTVREIRIDNQMVKQAKKGDVCSLACSQLVRRNDRTYKLVSKNETPSL
jgi:U32 family peptidase